MKKARITEIFSSIQGEGLYVGHEQIFVRFYGCNFGCKFCDEKHKKDFSLISSGEVTEKIFTEGKDMASFTGGEPLLNADFLKEVLPSVRKKKVKTYLETNGLLTDELKEVINDLDVIAMDIKLPSSTGKRGRWQEHECFLKEADKKEVFVKSVITKNTSLSDIRMAVSVIKEVGKDIPFILQPVSYNDNIERIEMLREFFYKAKESLNHVRIIPQVHKILGVR